MACFAAAGASSRARAFATKVPGTALSSRILIRRHTPARPPYVPQVIAARSCVPGRRAVVCTEKGGPFPSDQFSHRHVITTTMRASFGQEKPLDFFFGFFIANPSTHGLVCIYRERGVVGLRHVDLGVSHVLVE